MAKAEVTVHLAEPESVKQLIADLTARAERAEAAEADLRATVERVRELHAHSTKKSPSGAHTYIECAECGYADGGRCPTLAALDAQRPAEGGPERSGYRAADMPAPDPGYRQAANHDGLVMQHACGYVRAFNRPPSDTCSRCGYGASGVAGEGWKQLYLRDAALDSTTPPPSPEGEGAVPLRTLMAAVDNALRNGSYMTNANLAFEVLCDQLGVHRDSLAFEPRWAHQFPPAALDGGQPDTPAPTRQPMCPACEIEHAPPMHYDAAPAPTRSGEEQT